MDEETQVQAENVVAADESSVDTSPVAETTTSEETETEVTTPSAEVSGEETETTERKPSRAERRIRDLTQRLHQNEQQPNQQFAQLQRPPQPMFEDGREYSAQELEQRVVQAADNMAALRSQAQIEQFKAQMNLDRDVEVLPTQYPELDDTKEDFVPELVDSIEEEYRAKAFRNGVLDSSVRLADIAQRQVKAARAVAKKANANMKNAVASQADTAAPKPGTGVRQEKAIEDMSSDEIMAMMKKQGRFIKA